MRIQGSIIFAHQLGLLLPCTLAGPLIRASQFRYHNQTSSILSPRSGLSVDYGIYRTPRSFQIEKWNPDNFTYTITEEEYRSFDDDNRILKQFEGCGDGMRKHIIQGFIDARTLLGDPVDQPKDFAIDWRTPSAVEYLGGASRTKKYRGLVSSNLGRANMYLNEKIDGGFIPIKCTDPLQLCGHKGVYAYVPLWEKARPGERDYMNFCRSWGWVPTLDTQLEEPTLKHETDVDEWMNTGNVFLHEMMHLVKVASAPKELLRIDPSNKVLQIIDVQMAFPRDPSRVQPGLGK
ncbi:hypothetical protein DRE_04334 [Drechslerella stenobrocha 248]|uniref:Lysine-specific metallo-endopeptidase domain-containing protein n=1 Tax=Drechslerella stenobrocha 248 TaxID=1043628 RepID=W7HQF3_9PEZI|nr:hypothetical protein DRE_04334 [Drechslerella stenobrocha 248]